MTHPPPPENQLLAALPAAAWQRWQPLLEPVTLALGQVLHESGRPLAHVHFPRTAVVSLLQGLADGSATEIAMVGHEGVVGLAVFLGGASTLGQAVVHSAGLGWRLPAAAARAEFERGGAVQQQLLRYTQALLSQIAQTAVCNRHHTLEQQLCRWLLLSLDRQHGSDLVMTQELIARMLGVRREGVTGAALRLQGAGLIRYARGHIAVLDRGGLQARSCECHEVVRAEYERLRALD